MFLLLCLFLLRRIALVFRGGPCPSAALPFLSDFSNCIAFIPLPPTHAVFFLPPGAKKEPYHFGELHKYGRVLLFEIPVGEGMGERQRGMVRKDKRKKQWVITNERD